MAGVKAGTLGAGKILEMRPDIRTLGQHFCAMAAELGTCRSQAAVSDGTSNPSRIELAKWIYRERLSRSRVSGADDLGEHAWNMLLDLFISDAEGRVLDVTSLALGSGAPSTTALRWIQILERQKLVCRVADRRDRRRWFVELTTSGSELMERYFDTVGDLKS